jgi:hypothetical protein
MITFAAHTTIMKIIGFLFGLISLLLSLIGFIPMLGWLNWLFVPFAIIGLIVSSITNSSGGKTMSIVAIIVGMLRLILGGGVL